jgi:hypothetical protein
MPGFNMSLLRGLDLSMWTPIASRPRRRPPPESPFASKPARHTWRLVEHSPLSVEQVTAAREAGVLLTALRPKWTRWW